MNNFRTDLMRSVLWQYEDAEKLKQLVQSEQQFYDANVSGFYEDWYRDVFSIDTANEFGLHIWGRILDVPLGIATPADKGGIDWGFGPNHENFEHGNFSSNVDVFSFLTLEQKRLIIKLRYIQLTTRPSVVAINEAMKEVFADRGDVYVIDSMDMSYVTFMLDFAPDLDIKVILDNYDLLPRPATVGVKWQFKTRGAFGFGPHHENFNNGNFATWTRPPVEPSDMGDFGFGRLHANFSNGNFAVWDRPLPPIDEAGKFGFGDKHENFDNGNFGRR